MRDCALEEPEAQIAGKVRVGPQAVNSRSLGEYRLPCELRTGLRVPVPAAAGDRYYVPPTVTT